MKYNAMKYRKHGIYLLPNLLTTAGIFAAFYAIVSAMNGEYPTACVAIFVAMLTDTFDGRIARMTNTESDFGAEYDSMSDMVAFGIAPSLVVYSWSLNMLGKWGWLIAFFYTATTALRLARFNTQVGVAAKQYFQGLPCPSAAAVVTAMVWCGSKYDITGATVNAFVAVITFSMGVLMVSTIRYNSFKEIDFKGKSSFLTIFLVVLLFVAIASDPPSVLFVGFFIYTLSGPVLTWQRLRGVKSKSKRQKQEKSK